MKISVVTKPLAEVRAGALVVLRRDDGFPARPVNSQIAGHLAAFEKSLEKKETRAEWFCTLEKSAVTRHLLIDSLSFGQWAPPREKIKIAAARAVEICRRYSITDIAFACQIDDAADFASLLLEGAALGDFTDNRFKSAPEDRPPLTLSFIVNNNAKETKRVLDKKLVICQAANFARELANAPNNELTPDALAREAAAIAKKLAAECEILDEKQIAKKGYRLIEYVGGGSQYPPRLITLRHKPKQPRVKQHIVLLGKGVCFDTGGYCIKPGSGMHTMNGDMGGAAAILGAMRAILELQLPVRVTAVIPAAVNAVDGAAYMPGCIIKSKSGKTVYIENTDAEGRLLLADGMARAALEKPDILIDMATLTGAAGHALGPQIGALFSDDERLADALKAAADATGDEAWRLPLFREYEQYTRHRLADYNNIAPALDGRGGAITAALFLRAFVPEGVRWAHFDMSMPSRARTKIRYYNVGATGWGVRLLLHALDQWAETSSII